MKLIAATALAVLLAWPAAARECAPDLEKVLMHLFTKFGESVRSHGIASNGALVITTASDSGSWTMLVTAPGGPVCVLAAGGDFATFDAEPAGEDM